MPEILSTNKPFNPNPKPEPKVIWNDRSYQSYIEAGFPDHIPHSITAPRDRIMKFLSAVDLRKGPIERTVTTMVRVRGPDYSTQKHERKEWIYYYEDWTGVNWLGVPIFNPISEHIEGLYSCVVTRPKYDAKTGDHVDNAWGGTRTIYYIPWSKKNVDDIISKSVHTDKSGIKFYIKFGSEDSDNHAGYPMRNMFTYDQFVNWSWEKLYEWITWPVDELMMRPKAGKSATKLEFKPS